MLDPRMTGLESMGISTAAFLGTSSGTLPAITFFPALLLFALGAIKFIRSNSAALADAEKRVERRINPRIRENRHAHAQAERLAARQGNALNSVSETDPEIAARAASREMESRPGGSPIEIDAQPGDFVVTNDVSFPLEVQSGDALTDQLQKLNELMGQGVLTEEEYAIAKAKPLG